jgi:tetratricopeptide (TPR) repeat protein
LREALAAAEAVGLTFIVDTVHCHLAETLHRMGLYEEARVHAELAVDGFRAEKDKRMECGSLTYLARALASLGETERALATIEAAVTLARTARQMLPTALATLAEMEISAGRSAEALAHTDEAMATLREVHTDGSSEIEARAILDGRMATIRDDHFRVTFARVEENALLLAHR